MCYIRTHIICEKNKSNVQNIRRPIALYMNFFFVRLYFYVWCYLAYPRIILAYILYIHYVKRYFRPGCVLFIICGRGQKFGNINEKNTSLFLCFQNIFSVDSLTLHNKYVLVNSFDKYLLNKKNEIILAWILQNITLFIGEFCSNSLEQKPQEFSNNCNQNLRRICSKI